MQIVSIHVLLHSGIQFIFMWLLKEWCQIQIHHSSVFSNAGILLNLYSFICPRDFPVVSSIQFVFNSKPFFSVMCSFVSVNFLFHETHAVMCTYWEINGKLFCVQFMQCISKRNYTSGVLNVVSCVYVIWIYCSVSSICIWINSAFFVSCPEVAGEFLFLEMLSVLLFLCGTL